MGGINQRQPRHPLHLVPCCSGMKKAGSYQIPSPHCSLHCANMSLWDPSKPWARRSESFATWLQMWCMARCIHRHRDEVQLLMGIGEATVACSWALIPMRRYCPRALGGTSASTSLRWCFVGLVGVSVWGDAHGSLTHQHQSSNHLTCHPSDTCPVARPLHPLWDWQRGGSVPPGADTRRGHVPNR